MAQVVVGAAESRRYNSAGSTQFAWLHPRLAVGWFGGVAGVGQWEQRRQDRWRSSVTDLGKEAEHERATQTWRHLC